MGYLQVLSHFMVTESIRGFRYAWRVLEPHPRRHLGMTEIALGELGDKRTDRKEGVFGYITSTWLLRVAQLIHLPWNNSVNYSLPVNSAWQQLYGSTSRPGRKL